MANIQQIEREIKNLPPEELIKFRAWFEKFDADIWDKQLESDVKSKKLDDYAKKAIKDFKNGKFKEV